MTKDIGQGFLRNPEASCLGGRIHARKVWVREKANVEIGAGGLLADIGFERGTEAEVVEQRRAEIKRKGANAVDK